MYQIEANQYGNIDVRKGISKRYYHLKQATYGKIQIKSVCKALHCPSVPAMTDFYKKYGRWHPVIDGIVVPARFEELLLKEIRARLVRQEERQKRDPNARHFLKFEKQYGSPDNALVDAAQAMFDLNRYAKICERKAEISTIYSLKNQFIRLLYDLGKCVSAQKHIQQTEEKECWGCEGDGCERCDDTGIYKKAGTIAYYSLAFEIEGKRFAWHQPEDSVLYRIALTEEDAPMPDLNDMPRPVGEWGANITKAKALVRWVVAGVTKQQIAA